MTNLKNEMQSSWKVVMNNFYEFITIISLLFVAGQTSVLIHNIFISGFLKMIILPLTVFLQLIVVHIVINFERDKKDNMKDVMSQVFKEPKEVIIIIGLELLFLLISILSFIPIIPVLIFQSLYIFVWPIFVLEEKRRVEAIMASGKLVLRNILDLLKYLGLYAGIIIIISLATLAEGSDMMVIDKIVVITLRYFERFITIFFTIMVTRLYLQYKEKYK